MKPQDNKDLLRAFPLRVCDDVLAVVSVLPENPHGVGSSVPFFCDSTYERGIHTSEDCDGTEAGLD